MFADERSFVVEAQVGKSPLHRLASNSDHPTAIDAASMGLSERLVIAIHDWQEFFDEIDGDLSDPLVADEFVGQGFKIAHRLRAEIKGSTVHLIHPVRGEAVEIERNQPH